MADEAGSPELKAPIRSPTDVQRPWPQPRSSAWSVSSSSATAIPGATTRPNAILETGIASARALQSGTLAAAHLDAAADAVHRILIEEAAVALTSYDDNGIYGHIDHVQVHEIAIRSVEGTSCEHYESTIDRSVLRRLRKELVGRGLVTDRWPSVLSEQLGSENNPALVTVDVTGQLPYKLAAVATHSSQVLEATNVMGLPAGAFHRLLGTEWYRVARRGRGRFVSMLHATDDLEVHPVAV